MVLYVLMGVLVAMSVHTSGCDITNSGSQMRCRSLFRDNSPDWPYFAAAASIGQFVMGCLFIRARRVEAARRWATIQGVGALLAAMWWVVATVAAKTGFAMRAFSALIIVVHLSGETISKHHGYFLPTLVPNHLSARTRKFTVVMISTIVAGSVQPSDTYNLQGFASAGAFLLWAAMLKISYFDIDQAHKVGFTSPAMLTEVLWVCANYTLALALSSMGACAFTTVRLANTPPGKGEIPKLVDERLRWLTCVSTSGAMVASTIIQLALRGAGSGVRVWRKRHRVALRMCLGIAPLLVPVVFSEDTPHWVMVLVLTGALALQIIGDLYGRQHKENVRQDKAHRRMTRGLLAARDAVGSKSVSDKWSLVADAPGANGDAEKGGVQRGSGLVQVTSYGTE